MARIRLSMPEKFIFTTELPVRITDLNYGGHVGNDTILTLIHEARMLFLRNAGYTEMNAAGASLIMSDVGIEFKNELFYGDRLQVKIIAAEFTRVGFDIFYQLEKITGDRSIIIALAKTGMVCYNYEQKKVTSLPQELIQTLGTP